VKAPKWSVLVLVPQWRDEVPERASVAFGLPCDRILANGLYPADLDELGLIGRIRVMRPFPKVCRWTMPLDRLAWLGGVDLADARRGGRHQESDNQQEMAQLAHGVHLLLGTRPSSRLAGRQGARRPQAQWPAHSRLSSRLSYVADTEMRP